MSEFKFACPVCGQHIKCDSTKSGSQMECPTCYRKIVVPQAREDDTSKLVLKASEVQSRPAPQNGIGAEAGVVKPAARTATLAVFALVVLACAAAGAVFAFREKIFKRSPESAAAGPDLPKKKSSAPPFVPPVNDTNWNLNLAGMEIPDAPVAGRINGRDFTLERATLQGGTLTFRQGAGKTADLGLTINLFAKEGQDLAGQIINIETDREQSPKLTLRWKKDDEKSATKNFTTGYALRLEFGQVNGKRISGKIYLCAPDNAHSYAAGTFDAEIRKPPTPKTQTPKAATPK